MKLIINNVYSFVILLASREKTLVWLNFSDCPCGKYRLWFRHLIDVFDVLRMRTGLESFTHFCESRLVSAGTFLCVHWCFTPVYLNGLLERYSLEKELLGKPDDSLCLLETFKEFQFPPTDCSMSYYFAIFSTVVPYCWYSLVFLFFILQLYQFCIRI